jgi:hypothetical protein
MNQLRLGAVFLCLVLAVMACKPAEKPAGETAGTAPAARSTASTAAAVQKPEVCPPPGESCPGSVCQTAITAASATFPATACPRFGEFQSDVDTFAWNEFIALNWPATLSNCSPDTSKSILNVKSGDGTVAVWQTWMPPDRVFVAPGRQPAAWCKGNGLDAHGRRPLLDIAKADGRFAKLGAAFAKISEPTGVLEPGGVLTDQSGRWVRYEIVMNQDEYNYTIQNTLWSKAGQQAFKNAGNNAINLPTGPTGAVELKASWKVLTDAEKNGGRYFTTVATVYNNAEGAPSPGPNPVTLGLVGLHIIHKTPEQTSFFWSTFEQVDNDNDGVFHKTGSNTTPNKQTAQTPYIELTPDGTPINIPVQVKREHSVESVDDIAPLINAYYQALLNGSVLQYYRLISTQWQAGAAPQGTPAFVANVTLETYVQNLQDGKKSGCLACHTTTGTAVPKLGGNHSFLFATAK